MKRIILVATAAVLTLSSCRKDDPTVQTSVDIATQNAYDDQAAARFLTENYLDNQGNIVPYSATSTADDNIPSLATMNKETLPSGVIIIRRANAQPANGKSIGATDVIRIMHRTKALLAREKDGIVQYVSGEEFKNTLGGSGTPEVDPFYYYAKKSVRGTHDRSYFEIEGFREALQTFKSAELPDDANYNLQGVIIVPSRAAYARDANVFDRVDMKFNDRTFIFNFQVYKTSDRPAAEL